MDDNKTTPEEAVSKRGAKYSTSGNSQCNRLLTELMKAKGKGMTSYEIREELDIYCATARITDLRKRGNTILTLRDRIDTGKGEHDVARWVLMNTASAKTKQMEVAP